ncbi:MAG: tetratricopeptide repeat protein [Bacteroidia bacterium]
MFVSFLIAQKKQNSSTDNYSDLFEEQESFEFFNELPRALKTAPFPQITVLSEQRLKSAEKSGNQKVIATTANNLGLVAIKKQDFYKALGYLIKSINARTALNDKDGIAITAGEIGYVHYRVKDYSKALQYFYSAYELSGEQNLVTVKANIAALMGIVYFKKKDILSGEKYFNNALSDFTTLDDDKSRARLNNKMAELYLERNDYAKALKHFRQSMVLYDELNNTGQKAVALRNIGIVYFKKGDYEKALEYFNNSLAFSNQLIVKKLIKDTYLKLATVYSFQKKYDKADAYHDLYRNLKDSITYFESSKKFTQDDLQHEVTEKEKVIELLSKANEEQIKILNQQGLELSQQLTATELERQSKEKALEELSVATLEKKEKEKQVLLLSKQKAEKDLQLSKKELELSRKNALMYALTGGALIFLLLTFLIYSRYRYKKKSNEVLNVANKELQETLDKLKSTQAQLIYSQKMASLGQLTAGIAHEIQNPLNFVNNFSEISAELVDEFVNSDSEKERKGIAENLKQNFSKISHHGKRADTIVKNMLQHSRSGVQEKQPTDINALAEEFINLAYHGMRATNIDFNCTIEKNLDKVLPKINVVPQDISRVMLNIFNNAFYAVKEKSKTANHSYKPTVGISAQLQNHALIISITDNGHGIPDEVKDKIFDPFFTTKPAGEGTGIGLSLSYDIITHGHNGTIRVESKENIGTSFFIELPA